MASSGRVWVRAADMLKNEDFNGMAKYKDFFVRCMSPVEHVEFLNDDWVCQPVSLKSGAVGIVRESHGSGHFTVINFVKFKGKEKYAPIPLEIKTFEEFKKWVLSPNKQALYDLVCVCLDQETLIKHFAFEKAKSAALIASRRTR